MHSKIRAITNVILPHNVQIFWDHIHATAQKALSATAVTVKMSTNVLSSMNVRLMPTVSIGMVIMNVPVKQVTWTFHPATWSVPNVKILMSAMSDMTAMSMRNVLILSEVISVNVTKDTEETDSLVWKSTNVQKDKG